LAEARAFREKAEAVSGKRTVEIRKRVPREVRVSVIENHLAIDKKIAA
jgi:hypothetical protein